MKKYVIYFILFFYSAIQLKPLTTLIQDVLAHTFWEMQHIATMHQQRGHHHLHNELKDISENHQDNSLEKMPTSQKINLEMSIHLYQYFNIKFKNCYSYILHSTISNSNLISIYIPINSPPPKL